MAALRALAPAKVNLFLHVGPPRDDGYHPLVSLAAFADLGDAVTARRADGLSLTVEGPFGAGLATDDNLILTALRALGARTGVEPGLAVTLDKRLPVASGLGGGSSDAAAALKLARRVLKLDIDDAGLAAVARAIGADGPMCVAARAAWAEGLGETLTPEPRLPPLHAVLVNPGVPSPTGAVYRAYDAAPRAADRPAAPADWSAAAVIAWLSSQRNDLEAPAVRLNPVIGEALAAVGGDPDVRLVRMSGSGATVFGLTADRAGAAAAAARLSGARPAWWVRAVSLS